MPCILMLVVIGMKFWHQNDFSLEVLVLTSSFFEIYSYSFALRI